MSLEQKLEQIAKVQREKEDAAFASGYWRALYQILNGELDPSRASEAEFDAALAEARSEWRARVSP